MSFRFKMIGIVLMGCLGLIVITLNLVVLYLNLTKHDKSVVKEIGKNERLGSGIEIVYASNVKEDWERLEKFLTYAENKTADVVILTNVFENPLSYQEQGAYSHAYRHINKAYQSDRTFSDVQQYIDSFKIDPAKDIVTISARKILNQIEMGTEVLRGKIAELKELLSQFELEILIIPGPFENLDVIRAIDPDFASNYLNLKTIDVKNVRLLGIGGLATVDERAPLYFQNREYIEGTEQSNDELRNILQSEIDVFISFSPIRYFTDNVFEDQNVRDYLCDYLPGKVILTSQALSEDPMEDQLTASDAVLIRGGHFKDWGQFWEIKADRNGLIEKELIKMG